MQLTQLTPSTSAQNPSIFKFGQNEIRVFEKNHEPWFSAFDIAKCLGLQNVTRATASLRDSERSNLKLERGGSLVIVSESGLYTMILRSDSAIKEGTPAFNFRVWVTDDLLPTLRKTGSYSCPIATITPSQQLRLREAVAKRAQAVASHYQTIYRALYARFQIPRYSNLLAKDFEAAIEFIRTVDLRVPEVPKAPEPVQETEAIHVQPQRDILTRLECERLLGFVYEFKYLHKRDLDAIYDLLKAVHSPLAASFWELKESWSIGNLERVLAAHGYKVQDLDCYKHLMNA